MNHNKRVLVAPLDWGLGHASRCVPIIRALLAAGCQVTLAGEKQTAELLKKEFPELELIHLKGYRVSYPSKGLMFVPKIIIQLPKIFKAIQYERAWIKVQQDKLQGKWDVVISDNRYGLHHEKLKNILITHQLGIISGMGNWVDRLFIRYSYKWLKHFDHIWVPDSPGENNLSGILSRPSIMPQNVTYIGPLSRLTPSSVAPEHILVLLSGPEPQRTILEKKLIRELHHLSQKVLFVRGLPAESRKLFNTNQTTFVNFLPSGDMELAIAKASFVICRSGYSSIMDLAKMGKKAILIPTPGQTEQVYLAAHLKSKGCFVVMDQKKMNLTIAENLIDHANGVKMDLDFNLYQQALQSIGIQ